jgi:hypothetical protein
MSLSGRAALNARSHCAVSFLSISSVPAKSDETDKATAEPLNDWKATSLTRRDLHPVLSTKDRDSLPRRS